MSSTDTMQYLRNRRQPNCDSGEDEGQEPRENDSEDYARTMGLTDYLQLSRAILLSEIERYVIDAFMHSYYGDFVSSERWKIFEPQYPPPNKETSIPQLPNHSDLSSHHLGEILQANGVIGWYCNVPRVGPLSQAEAVKQKEIEEMLELYWRKKEIHLRTHEGSGQTLLYHNLPDAAMELYVSTLINRAHLQIQRGDLSRAGSLVAQALDFAILLDYEPLNARCHVWEAVIADKKGNFEEAAGALIKSQPCVNKYAEGEVFKRLSGIYKNELLDQYDHQRATGNPRLPSRGQLSRKLSDLRAGKRSAIPFSAETLSQPGHISFNRSDSLGILASLGLDISQRREDKEFTLEAFKYLRASGETSNWGRPRSMTNTSMESSPPNLNSEPKPEYNNVADLISSIDRNKLDWEKFRRVSQPFSPVTQSKSTHSSAKPMPLNIERSKLLRKDTADAMREETPQTSPSSMSSLYRRLLSQVGKPSELERVHDPAPSPTDNLQNDTNATAKSEVGILMDQLSALSGNTEALAGTNRAITGPRALKVRKFVQKSKIDQEVLGGVMRTHRSQRLAKIQAKFRKVNKGGIGIKGVISVIHQEELEELRDMFGNWLPDPYEDEYRELLDIQRQREIKQRQMLQAAPKWRPQTRSSEAALSRVPDSGFERRKSAPEVILSDTPAVAQVEALQPNNPFSPSSVRFADQIRGEVVVKRISPRRLSIPDVSTGSSGPIHTAEINGIGKVSGPGLFLRRLSIPETQGESATPSPLRKSSLPVDSEDCNDKSSTTS